jgi:uncharacterized protein YjdB
MAAPIVSGAAALYLSTLPESARPKNARDVAAVAAVLRRNTIPARSPQIGRIIHVGNMFNAIPTTFEIRNGGEVLTNRNAAIPNNSTVTIRGNNFLVYTTNGTNPAIRNGVVTNGERVLNGEMTINLSALPVGKVSIRALGVNSRGVVGRVATLNITTTAAGTMPGMSAIEGPQFLAVGRSAKYSARVTAAAPPGSGNTVIWDFVARDSTANEVRINSSNGTLSAPAGASGTVTIRALARNNPAVYSDRIINITPPMAEMSINLPSTLSRLVVGAPSFGTVPSAEYGSVLLESQFALEHDLVSQSGIGNRARWTTSNANIATVDQTGVVTARGSGNATITATATDGSGRSARTTIINVLPIRNVTITNATRQMTPGSEVALRATITPARPTNAGIVWSLEPALGELRPIPMGLSINPATGRLNVGFTVPVDYRFNVIARAVNDYSDSVQGIAPFDSVQIDLTAQRATAVRITTSDNSGRTAINSKTQSISTIRLFNVNPPSTLTQFDINAGSNINDSRINLSATALIGVAPLTNVIIWTSSNERVATVSSTGVVNAVGPGRATITATASDGSNRRASCTVNVSVPASSLWVQGRNPQSRFETPTLAFGRSMQMNAVPGAAYGKVTNTRVTWSRSVMRATSMTMAPYMTASAAINSKVSISSSGRLSVNASLWDDWFRGIGNDELVVRVTATAQDGSRVSRSIDVRLVPATGRMFINGVSTANRVPANQVRSFSLREGWGRTLYITQTQTTTVPAANIPAGVKRSNFTQWGNYRGDYIITSSNPRVAAVNGVNGFMIIGLRPGKATIRVVSNDGTNRSASVSVTVTK